jgi:hypothetical protein
MVHRQHKMSRRACTVTGMREEHARTLISLPRFNLWCCPASRVDHRDNVALADVAADHPEWSSDFIPCDQRERNPGFTYSALQWVRKRVVDPGSRILWLEAKSSCWSSRNTPFPIDSNSVLHIRVIRGKQGSK